MTRGAEVEDVQQKLIAIGYYLPSGADGKYGKETYTAVEKFQHNVGIKEDGLAGEVTRAKLNNAYNTRSSAKANNLGCEIASGVQCSRILKPDC